MIKDHDLDVMNILKAMSDDDTAFYVRTDNEDGFFYYTGTAGGIGEALAALMDQDEVIHDAVICAATKYLET